MIILWGKGGPSDIGSFRPFLWNDATCTSNPCLKITQIMDSGTAPCMRLSGARAEPVAYDISFGDRVGGLLGKRRSSALLADCGAFQRGAQ